MTVDWLGRIAEAQRLPFYRLNGQMVERVRFGSEREDWGANHGPCHDCGALKGQFHVPECDVERCPVCDGQVFGCECAFDDADYGRAYPSR